MRIDSPISLNAIITGSFTGSFKGDGSQLTGITAEWDGSHTGNASIDGDLTVSNLITAGNVDGVDVSDLKVSVDANTSAIAGLDSTYATDAQLSSVSGALASDVAANASAIAGLDSTYATDAALSSVSGALASDVAANASAIAGLDSTYATDAQLSSVSASLQGRVATNEAAIAGLDSTYATDAALSAHATATDNPHSVTKAQVGLGNVDNTSDLNKPISTATQTALNLKGSAADVSQNASDIAANTTAIATKATPADVTAAVNDLINGAGTAYDTLKELGDAIVANDSDIATILTTQSGKLAKASNLSDLTNVGTARTNLGLGSAATTNSTAYATAAQGTKADTAHGWGDHSLVGYLTSYVDTNTTYSAGTGLGLSGTTFSHSDTSTQTSVNNSGRTYIQDITLDGFGHVTGISSATETVVNTDTNTTYTAGTGLGLSGTTFSHSDTSTQGSVNNSGRTYIQDITLDGFGHVTGIASATETVVNTDTNTTYSAGTGVTLSGTTFSIGQAVATNSNVSFASVTATGNITAYSDASLKKDVKTIEGALDKTKALRGVEFTRIADDAKSIGVIAQELETVLPELVVTDDKGIKAVNYAQITGLLIEAVKELSAKVDELSK